MNLTINLDAYVRTLSQLVLMIALVEDKGHYTTVCQDGLISSASDVTELADTVVKIVEAAGYVVKELTLYVLPMDTVTRLMHQHHPPRPEEHR